MNLPQIDEEVIFGPDLIGQPVVRSTGQLITATDVSMALRNRDIVKNSWVSNYPVILNYRDGVVKIPAGSFLNHASTGEGVDSIRILTSYMYQVEEHKQSKEPLPLPG